LASEPVQRRLAAILEADIAGYSRLMGDDEEGTLAQLKLCRQELIDPRIAQFRGRIVKTSGDAMLVEFASAVDAVRCAFEVQQAMATRTAQLPVNKRILFRIGIHVGDIIIDGEDIYGDGVNIAARLEQICEPGGICVSSTVRDSVVDKLDIPFKHAGEQSLKNINRPVRVFRIDMAGQRSAKASVGPVNRKAIVHRMVGGVMALVVALIAAISYIGIPAKFLIDGLLSRVETDTGYRLQVHGGSKLALRPSPTLLLRNISAFSTKRTDAPGQLKAESFRLEAETIRLSLSLADLLIGHPKISEITLSKPTLTLPLSRRRPEGAPRTSASGLSARGEGLAIERVHIEEGRVIFYSAPDQLESSIDHINLDGSLATAQPSIKGSLSAFGRLVHLEIKSETKALELQNIPIDFTVQSTELPNQALRGQAELTLRNTTLAVNALSGRIGESAFNGWAKLDFVATKPLIKGDLNFDQIQIGSDNDKIPPRSVLSEPWSEREFDLKAFNFFDADMRITADAFAYETFKIAPASVDAVLNAGSLHLTIIQAALYGGEATGAISLDASGPVLAHTARVRLDSVDALPLLLDTAGFERLQGKMNARVDLDATGASERAVIAKLSGIMDFQLVNGAIRGIDIAKIMRQLTTNIVQGWEMNPADKTELSAFSASFHVTNGKASVEKLEIAGPIVRVTGTGTIDLPGKTLQMTVNPRLTAGLTGLGVPVIIAGNWDEPRIYPDVAGILDNPDGIYEQLRSAGKGLFGELNQSGKDKPAPTDQLELNSILQGLGKIMKPPATNRRSLPESSQ
jgi:AsmA protein